MKTQFTLDGIDTLEVLSSVVQERGGTVVLGFIDGSGRKIRLRLHPQVARDLVDELSDLSESR
ncbi:MAG: hypothetical protein HYX63_02850 [Gammaproteobacteria bacterium]|nr:hypothetical protein [Gammaproteobacteria bacterium]